MTTGLVGIVNASIEVVRRLEAQGHEVTCASPWEPTGERMAREGIRYVQLRPMRYEPLLPANGGPLAAWRGAAARRRQAIADLGLDEFGARLDALGPDLVLADAELLEHVMAAVMRGARVALLNQFVGYWKRPGLPPATLYATPRAGRARIEWAWWTLRLRRTRDAARAALRSGRTDRRSILRRVAHDLGFPLGELASTTWSWPGFRSLPLVQLTARELDFPHAPQPNVRFVGPMVADERKDDELDAADRTRLDRAIAEAKRSDRRVLYGSFGTKNPADRGFAARLIEAVRGQGRWLLVLARGEGVDGASLAGAPNVETFGWLPQLEVLHQADASITHGGIHTIHESLHCRVPLLVGSGRRYDQEGNAARVEFHGVGRCLDRDRASVAEIREQIGRVLDDPILRANVDAMQRAFEAYATNGALERTVDELLAAPPATIAGAQDRLSRKRSSSS